MYTFSYTFDQLRIFKVVSYTKNFNKAAKILYISQPTLVKNIKLLESSIQLKLFHQTNNKISLTKNGKHFLKYVRRILLLCEESKKIIRQIKKKNINKRKIKIGISSLIWLYLFPDSFPNFDITKNHIYPLIYLSKSSLLIKKIRNQNLEIGIFNPHPALKVEKNLKVEKFLKNEFNLIVPVFYNRKLKLINQNDLYSLNFIELESNLKFKKFLKLIFHINNINLKLFKVIFTVNNVRSLKTAVKIGLGITILPYISINEERQFRILRIKNMKITRSLAILTHTTPQKSKPFLLFHKYFNR
uniref:Probable RuBisCO transcriptional regulator n=1 Tax=Astrosyne radiata TaxID=1158023 RepID=A0A2U9NTC6_9STRA|nr:rubisco operon transcription regulator [Astrosyne radiata]YP_009497674.1 rubisco operon transcription regulator [Astrosyne radiata]AWT40338.1 rubisco operon transcription regulator [Astrosyne radiata]AWT40387.1 rubisco operon transcription regulator [Astrosyne radiata]